MFLKWAILLLASSGLISAEGVTSKVIIANLADSSTLASVHVEAVSAVTGLIGTVTPIANEATTIAQRVAVVELATSAATIAAIETSSLATTAASAVVVLHEADHHHHVSDEDKEHNHTEHHEHEESHHANLTEVVHADHTVAVPLIAVKNTTVVVEDLASGNKTIFSKSETAVGAVSGQLNRKARQWGYGGYGGLGYGGLGYGGLGGIGYGGMMGYAGYGGLGGYGGFGGGPVVMDSISVTDVIV